MTAVSIRHTRRECNRDSSVLQWEKAGGARMFKPKRLSFEELSRRLRDYEERYGMSTIEFYRRYQQGELGDDPEMMMWAGLYHL